MSKILLVDCGFSTPGFVIADITPAGYRVIEWAATKTTKKPRSRKSRVSDDEINRIQTQVKIMVDLINRHNPVLIIMESPTGGSKNAPASKGMSAGKAFVVGVARGEIPIISIIPSDSKKACTGSSTGSKEALQAYIDMRDDIVWDCAKPKHKYQVEAVYDAIGALVAVEFDPVILEMRGRS